MNAFDADAFRARGHAVVDLLAAHLASSQRGDRRVIPAETPAALVARYPASFGGGDDLLALLQDAIDHSLALQSPRCIGHQVAAPLPDAALCDLVASLLNNGMAVFETGPASSAMERAVLGWFARKLGLPDTAGGVLTSGGSIGNLTALLAARQANAGFDVWRQGLKAGPPLAIFVADTAHYSVARAVRMLGLGDGGCIGVACDERLRMRVDALEQAIGDAKKKGRRPIAVVASAASTLAGAIDPLDAIAEVCASRGIWFHVDGAQGAALALSSTRRALVRGIERADSVVVDAHKMMMMPALATAVLFKDAKLGAGAFAQEAAYLFSDDGDAWSDIGRRTVECTKRMIALKLYACLRVYGEQLFADHVDRCCATATSFASLLRARGYDVLVEPECDIVVFRKGRDGGVTAAARKALLASGRFYIVSVHRPDGLWLRATVLHPMTTDDHLRALIDAVDEAYGAAPSHRSST